MHICVLSMHHVVHAPFQVPTRVSRTRVCTAVCVCRTLEPTATRACVPCLTRVRTARKVITMRTMMVVMMIKGGGGQWRLRWWILSNEVFGSNFLYKYVPSIAQMSPGFCCYCCCRWSAWRWRWSRPIQYILCAHTSCSQRQQTSQTTKRPIPDTIILVSQVFLGNTDINNLLRWSYAKIH